MEDFADLMNVVYRVAGAPGGQIPGERINYEDAARTYGVDIEELLAVGEVLGVEDDGEAAWVLGVLVGVALERDRSEP